MYDKTKDNRVDTLLECLDKTGTILVMATMNDKQVMVNKARNLNRTVPVITLQELAKAGDALRGKRFAICDLDSMNLVYINIA